ncbi:MAG: hypothetical protein MUF12_09215 [Sediminibacterium sp.]|jgi:hypothetical protein|nr:hypothetical protein [Sediminibacterium sp.]
MNIYFILTGFENQIPFIAKFTFTELAQNTGSHADTEMFYALKELHGKEISELPIYHNPMCVRLNRDDESSIGLIQRVSESKFSNFLS